MKSKLIILLLSLFSFQAYAAPGADIGKAGEAKDVQKVIEFKCTIIISNPLFIKSKLVKP